MQLMKKISTAALASTLAIATAMPVMAAPLSAPSSPTVATTPLIDVQYRRDYNDGPSWKGYKGSRHHRDGWRRNNNGWWYPLAAFGLGAAIGSQLNQPRVVVRGSGSAHVDWCYARYRSYRAWDNTYQPYNAPRRECYSPYG